MFKVKSFKRFIYISMVALLGMPVKGFAQYDPANIDTSAARTHGMRGFTTFDPAIYQVQKRYRPWEGDSAWSSEWWRHFTAGASTGMDVFHNFTAKQTNIQIPANFFVGYQFTPIHELRMQGGYEAVKKKDTPYGETATMGAYNVELQYLANLTNFMYGYNPNRRFTVSTLVSGGTHIFSNEAVRENSLSHKYSPYAKIGLHLGYKMSPNITFFVQPFIGVQQNQDKEFSSAYHDKYDLFGGFHSGFMTDLTESKQFYENMAPRYHSFFFESGAGWNFNMSNFNVDYSGNEYSIGFGRWVDPYFGFKFAGFGHQGYWNDNEANFRFRKSYVHVAGRAEVMVNIPNLFPKRRNSLQDPVFDLNVSGGVLYGYSGFYGAINNDIKNGKKRNAKTTSYYGFTGGLQALLKLAPGSYIFAEPRVSYLIYNNSSAYNSPDGPVSITDNGIFSVSVGTRIYGNSKTDKMVNDNVFVPHWWVGLDMGGMKLYQAHRDMGEGLPIQPSAGLNVGYDIGPYASLRLQSQWSMYSRTELDKDPSLYTTNYRLFEFRPMYMLSITNLLRGCDSHNTLQTYVEAGPTFSVYTGQSSNGTYKPKRRVSNWSSGVMMGMLTSYKVSNRWDLFAEVQGQYSFEKNYIAPDARSRERFFQNLKYGMSFGTRYHFLPWGEEARERLKFDLAEWQKGWFFEASAGWVQPYEHFSGNQYKFSFGRWMSPIFGLRAGVKAMQQYHGDAIERSEHIKEYNAQVAALGHVELLTDVLNWFPSLRNEERKFDLNIFGGLAFGLAGTSTSGILSVGDDALHDNGFMNETNISYGFTGGLQALLRVAPNVQLYLEPSITTLRNTVSYKVDRSDDKTYFPFAVSAGTRIMRPTDARALRRAGYRGDDIEGGINAKFLPSWWIAFQLGGSKQFRGQKYVNDEHSGLNVIQPTFSFNIAREFTPLSTLRAQVESSFMYMPTSNGQNYKHYNMTDLRLLYMLNFTNLWRGTRNQPKFSFYPEFGAGYSFKNYARFKDDAEHEHSKKTSFSVVAGMMGALRVSHEWDLIAESQMMHHFTPGYMNYYKEQAEGGWKWNVTAGVRYHVPEDKDVRRRLHLEMADWQKGWFVDLGAGVAHPLDNKSGNLYKVAVGHWFSSLFGFRFGVSGQQLYHMATPQAGRTEYNSQVVATGHIELFTDVLNWFPGIRSLQEERGFGINLYAGINAGAQAANYDWEGGNVGGSVHLGEGNLTREIGSTIGFNGGMQILGRVAPNVFVYLEPSYQFAQNRVAQYNTSKVERGDILSDGIFAVSVGTRITRTAETRALRKAGYNGEAIEGGLTAKFEPNWWASVQVGGAKRFLCQKYIPEDESGIGINPTFSLNGGRDLTSLSSFRAQFEMNMFKDHGETVEREYNYYDLRLLYMLNLTNLWRGTRNIPRFSIYPEIGVAYSHKSKLGRWDKNPNNAFGLVGGVMAAYRVSNQFDLTAESQIQQHFARCYMNQHHDYEANQKWNFTIGLRYHFKDKKK